MTARNLARETASVSSDSSTPRSCENQRPRTPQLPKLKRKGKKVLDVAHLLAAAVWLGGYVFIFSLLLVQKTGAVFPDPAAFDGVIETARLWVISPSTLVLMTTGLCYSLFTNWGFTRSSWVTAKWILSLAIVGASWHMPLTPTTVSLASAAIALLFVFSMVKPKLKTAAARKRTGR